MKRKRVEEKKPKKNSLNVTLIVAVVALVAVVIIVLSFKLSKSIYLAPTPSPTPPSTCPVPDKNEDKDCPLPTNTGAPILTTSEGFYSTRDRVIKKCNDELKELCETNQNNENEIFKNKCEKNEDPKYANVKCEHKSTLFDLGCTIEICYHVWTTKIFWWVYEHRCKVDSSGNDASWYDCSHTYINTYDNVAQLYNQYECHTTWGRYNWDDYKCNKALVASAGSSPSQLA